VIADRSREEDGIAAARAISGHLHSLWHDAETGGRDEHAVALALLDHLRVAGHDRHARFACRARHRLDDALQIADEQGAAGQLDDRLQLNLSVFRFTYKNQQVIDVDPITRMSILPALASASWMTISPISQRVVLAS